MAVFAYGKYFDDPAVLSYYHDTEFLKTVPPLQPASAEQRGLTQTPTQTTQKMDGNNGVNTSKDHPESGPTALESGRNRCLETVRAPTDQKAGSSNLSGRTKTREKPCVSCGFCLVFGTFRV